VPHWHRLGSTLGPAEDHGQQGSLPLFGGIDYHTHSKVRA
jgi:hypothetical protein